MAEVGLDSEHTIWRYQYDLRSNYPRIFSPNGIDLEARSLLDCLAEVRANETEETEQKKRFVFVSLDIGGIIVKKVSYHRLLQQLSGLFTDMCVPIGLNNRNP